MTERIEVVQVLPTFNPEKGNFLDAHPEIPLEYAVDGRIELKKLPYEYNPLSPTPLDPLAIHIADTDKDYYESAATHMSGVLLEASQSKGICNHDYQVILDEILLQHTHRSLKNTEAMGRLRGAVNGLELDRDTANLIISVRSGTGSWMDPARLLARFPAMEAVEAMKATRPLDRMSLRAANTTFNAGLMQESSRSADATTAIFYSGERAKPYKAFFDKDNPQNYITKAVEGEVAVDGVALELVARDTFTLLSPDSRIENPDDFIIRDLGGSLGEVVFAPVDTTKYFRVKKGF